MVAEPGTLVVSNADDPLVMRARAAGSPARQVTFGAVRTRPCVRPMSSTTGSTGRARDVQSPYGALHLDVPLAGRAQLTNVLAAMAVALEFGMSP